MIGLVVMCSGSWWYLQQIGGQLPKHAHILWKRKRVSDKSLKIVLSIYWSQQYCWWRSVLVTIKRSTNYYRNKGGFCHVIYVLDLVRLVLSFCVPGSVFYWKFQWSLSATFQLPSKCLSMKFSRASNETIHPSHFRCNSFSAENRPWHP